MSSMRNAVTRRPHKERAQPKSREKWGILEKHKDYSLRAQDYNLKKKKLGQLSQKAQERNPDEFAFGMLSQGKAGLGKHKASRTADGAESARLSHDAVKLLKTQDAGYLRTVAAKGRKEIDKLKEEVGLDSVTLNTRSAPIRPIHKTFADEDGEDVLVRGKKRTLSSNMIENGTRYTATHTIAEVHQVDAVMGLDIEDQENEPDVMKSRPTSKKAMATKQDAAARLRAERKKRKRLQEMRVAKLEALKTRQREILAAAEQLDLQRAKMARTVGGVNRNGVKFKIRERKK
ncbi:small-subunit processome [Exophiala viscosa]|uniref:Small-subunit processome n=1 Tax=Exophiala viscosa TaxID=2486360 RepID=A0AAN6DRV6_9EURO|nr:small-subunit processome [Exophiala viscosa]KAI1629041.1 small-subunit processome [Exophiala viscosa]